MKSNIISVKDDVSRSIYRYTQNFPENRDKSRFFSADERLSPLWLLVVFVGHYLYYLLS